MKTRGQPCNVIHWSLHSFYHSMLHRNTIWIQAEISVAQAEITAELAEFTETGRNHSGPGRNHRVRYRYLRLSPFGSLA